MAVDFYQLDAAFHENSYLDAPYLKSGRGVIQTALLHVRRCYRWLTGTENQRIHFLGRLFIELIDERKLTHDQVSSLSKKAISLLEGKENKVASLVKQRVIALQYLHGILPEEGVDEPQKQELAKLCRRFKETQKQLKKLSLSKRDWVGIEKISSRYKIFIEYILDSRNAKVQEKFLKFFIRDRVDPEVYIQFPKKAKELKYNNLTGRVGRHPGNILIKDREIHIPMVVMDQGKKVRKFYSIDHPETPLHFPPGHQTTVGKVIDCFRQKNQEYGEYVFTQKGVRYVDGSKDIPFEAITYDRAKNRYGEALKENQWVAILASSREYDKKHPLDINEAHALLGYARPVKGKKWKVYYKGGFPDQIPFTLFQKFWFLGKSVAGRFMFDANPYYTRRQFAHTAEILEPEDGVWFKDLLEGKFPFQIVMHNCARKAQDTWDRLMDHLKKPRINIFQKYIWEATPSGPMEAVGKLVNGSPIMIRPYLQRLFKLALFPWRSYTWEHTGFKQQFSYYRTKEFKSNIIYLPGALHEKLKEDPTLRRGRKQPYWLET